MHRPRVMTGEKGGRDVRDALGKSLKQLNQSRRRKRSRTALLLLLSLVVAADVFWTLR